MPPKMKDLPSRLVRPLDLPPAAAGIRGEAASVSQRGRQIVGGFEIEADIPIPIATGRAAGLILALQALDIGQSLFKPNVKTAYVPKAILARYPNRHYVARRDEKDGIAGVRIWRKS